MGKRMASIRFGKQMHEKASHPVYRPHRKAAWSMFWAVLLSLYCHSQSMISVDEDWITHSYHRNAGIRRAADTLLLPLPGLNQTHFLLVENPHLNHIDFLQVSEGKWIKVGDSLPFSHRPIPFRMFVFPIKGTNQLDTVRLVLEKKGENLSYTIRVLSKDAWESYLRADNLIAGFITGCYLLVFMIGIVLLYFHRQWKFVFFNAYVFTSLGWFLNDAGILFQILWPDDPSWHNSSRGFFSSVTMTFFGSYLYQNPGSRILGGVRKSIFVLAGIIALKITTGVMAAIGILPAASKPFWMHLNAVSLGGLFGYIGFRLLLNIRKYDSERFEILGIVIYSLFIFQLTLHELGLRPFDFGGLHHMELIVFFFLQITFMALHLFSMEKIRKEAEAERMLQLTREQDRILSEKLIEMEEQEKRRIARNIHDEIGSLFVAMKYRILSLRHAQEPQREDLDQLMHICNEGIEKQYSVVDDMVFQRNSGQDLEQAIREKFRQLFGNRSVDFKCSCPPDDKALNEIQKIQVYRIISELLTNTLKHAHAEAINVQIEIKQTLKIWYSDNGPGFELEKSATGRGVSNILNRVTFLQGTCRMLHLPKGAWSLDIEIPLRYE
jgi:signal transduction histidine kinase